MNFGDKAKQILGAIAPILGTAVGGPFGAMAGVILSSALGTPAGDDKAAEAALLAASPQVLAEIKKAEFDFQAKMKELGIEEEKLAYDDTASARAREATVKDYTPQIIAYGVVILTVALEGFLILGGRATVDGVILGRILGTLDGALMLVLSYYFGSSRGSDAKNATIQTLVGSTK